MKCNGPDSCRYRTADGRCIDNNECHHGVPDAPAADPTPGDCDTCEYDDGRCIKTVLKCNGYKQRVEPTGDPATENKPAAPRRIGQHWLEVAAERVRAGEDEATVMRDYGWRR